jgi:GDPmannose 4,6-dehydratase
MGKTALITGITGQDGAYLCEYLLGLGYSVYGTYRRTSSVNFWRLDELGVRENDNLKLVETDLTDLSALIRLIDYSKPDEVYNLAAQSFVGVSFDQPVTTAEITGIGALNVLEAIRCVNKDIRFYQASTSEMFGKVHDIPQSETTVFHPRSPYGVAKLYAHWITLNYQESYDIFGSSGILFNHESPLRGVEFVTRKITSSVARIDKGLQETLSLGNLDAKRDWGYAKDYVQGMHKIMTHHKPDVFVLATGRTETVRDFVTLSFAAAGRAITWQGQGVEEEGRDEKTGQLLVRVDPKFFRPAEVDLLVGDPSKAQVELGWHARTGLESLTQKMVEKDLARDSWV